MDNKAALVPPHAQGLWDWLWPSASSIGSTSSERSAIHAVDASAPADTGGGHSSNTASNGTTRLGMAAVTDGQPQQPSAMCTSPALKFTIRPPPPNKPIGLRLRTIKQGSSMQTVIVKVQPDSVAAAAGLASGMRILSINGRPVAGKASAIDAIDVSQTHHLEVDTVSPAVYNAHSQRTVAAAKATTRRCDGMSPDDKEKSNATAAASAAASGSLKDRVKSSSKSSMLLDSISVRSKSLSSLLEDYIVYSDDANNDAASVKSVGRESLSSFVLCDDRTSLCSMHSSLTMDDHAMRSSSFETPVM